MYLTGFGNHHQSEAIAGALPTRQNSPQQCPLGLYAEQLSGSAFTRKRHQNLSTWLYRALPSAIHHAFLPYSHPNITPFAAIQSPNPLRWSPKPRLTQAQDFIAGLSHVAGNAYLNTYLYHCNHSMTDRYFNDRDGELLFVPYEGSLRLHTELGRLEIAPGIIGVIPRGIVFKVELISGYAAGYLCENAGIPLSLPELGVIGANGLANPRHFLYPKAAYEDIQGDMTLISKYHHHWWITKSAYSPLDVVAWHGNYAPYAYDLSLFNTLNTVTFDHPDPSIFTVLTSESEIPGIANLDFVIFPPRWMVAEHTFRPPYYHRNIMSELMGLIVGEYDAKKDGFLVGGISIHNGMTAHGPDAASYRIASQKILKPQRYENTLAFMFESGHPWMVTEAALADNSRQQDYETCWTSLQRASI